MWRSVSLTLVGCHTCRKRRSDHGGYRTGHPRLLQPHLLQHSLGRLFEPIDWCFFPPEQPSLDWSPRREGADYGPTI
jgi:hypothetical protein